MKSNLSLVAILLVRMLEAELPAQPKSEPSEIAVSGPRSWTQVLPPRDSNVVKFKYRTPDLSTVSKSESERDGRTPAISALVISERSFFAKQDGEWLVFRFTPSVGLKNDGDETLLIPETDDGKLALSEVRLMETGSSNFRVSTASARLPEFQGAAAVPPGNVAAFKLAQEFDISVKAEGEYVVVLRIGVTDSSLRAVRWMTTQPFTINVVSRDTRTETRSAQGQTL